MATLVSITHSYQYYYGDLTEANEESAQYPLKLWDPYWIRLMDELIRKGLPRYIVEPALIKAEREGSIWVAYA